MLAEIIEAIIYAFSNKFKTILVSYAFIIFPTIITSFIHVIVNNLPAADVFLNPFSRYLDY